MSSPPVNQRTPRAAAAVGIVTTKGGLSVVQRAVTLFEDIIKKAKSVNPAACMGGAAPAAPKMVAPAVTIVVAPAAPMAVAPAGAATAEKEEAAKVESMEEFKQLQLSKEQLQCLHQQLFCRNKTGPCEENMDASATLHTSTHAAAAATLQPHTAPMCSDAVVCRKKRVTFSDGGGHSSSIALSDFEKRAPGDRHIGGNVDEHWDYSGVMRGDELMYINAALRMVNAQKLAEMRAHLGLSMKRSRGIQSRMRRKRDFVLHRLRQNRFLFFRL
eukprot:gene10116-8017_t